MKLNPQRSREEMLMSALLDSETLTDWEDEFLDSILNYWESTGSLTPNQLAKLEEINKKDETRK